MENTHNFSTGESFGKLKPNMHYLLRCWQSVIKKNSKIPMNQTEIVKSRDRQDPGILKRNERQK